MSLILIPSIAASVRIVCVFALLVSCSGREIKREKKHAPSPQQSSQPKTASSRPSAPPLSEDQGRSLLFSAFRAAGMVPVADHYFEQDGVRVTLDGFDFRRQLGFEYIAPGEENTDLTAKEASQLSQSASPRILIVNAADESTISSQVKAFLAHTM